MPKTSQKSPVRQAQGLRKAKSQKPKESHSKTRQIKPPVYKSFRVSKRIKQPNPTLTGSFRLFIASLRLLIRKRWLFGGIVLVYLVLTILLVKGFGVNSNIAELKLTVQELFNGNWAQLATGLTLFSVLLGNANSPASEVAGAYQSILLVLISLVIIWALRQSLASKAVKVTVRDAFYKGLYPVVPFLLVLIALGLQLVPLLVASFLYTAVIVGGIAVTAIEQGLWYVLFGLLVLLSLYMVTSSIFALYIVTLPDVRPLQALRSARELVRYRRWMVMRKLLFLPVALLVLTALIIIPIIILSPLVAEWLFFVLSMLAIAIVHSYIYHLYRELL